MYVEEILLKKYTAKRGVFLPAQTTGDTGGFLSVAKKNGTDEERSSEARSPPPLLRIDRRIEKGEEKQTPRRKLEADEKQDAHLQATRDLRLSRRTLSRLGLVLPQPSDRSSRPANSQSDRNSNKKTILGKTDATKINPIISRESRRDTSGERGHEEACGLKSDEG